MNTTTPKYYPNRVTIPKHIAEALDKILEYLWDDEQNNFNQSSTERQEGHIFNSLSILKDWLEGGDQCVEQTQ